MGILKTALTATLLVAQAGDAAAGTEASDQPAAGATAPALAAPAIPDPVVAWTPDIEAAAARFGVPAAWIERVMRAESAGRTTLAGRPITSRAGAMGLMQLMPETWAAMRADLRLGTDPYDPHDNIVAGAAYLRAMYDRFGYPGLFAAYNAGPGRYAGHLLAGKPLPAETRAYLADVAGPAVQGPAQPAIQRGDTLFFAVGMSDSDGRLVATRASAAGLFASPSPR